MRTAKHGGSLHEAVALRQLELSGDEMPCPLLIGDDEEHIQRAPLGGQGNSIRSVGHFDFLRDEARKASAIG
jgi:hypothetical protein